MTGLRDDAGDLIRLGTLARENGLGEIFTGLLTGVYEEPQNAVQLVAAERGRQLLDEGWTPEHDDEHTQGELARAAAAYAWPDHLTTRDGRSVHRRLLWPWDDAYWKPSGNRTRELVKAGALIVAEIGRLRRIPAFDEERVAP